MIVFDTKTGLWEAGCERESRIDELLLRHPEVLQETLYPDYTILPLAGGTSNQFKNIDALFLGYSEKPVLIVVENKLAGNTQARNYAVGQVIAYSANLANTPEEEFRTALHQHLAHERIAEAHQDSDSQVSHDRVVDASVQALADGRIHMVVCTEGGGGQHEKLRRNVEYINRLFESDVEVLRAMKIDEFRRGKDITPAGGRALCIAAALELAPTSEAASRETPTYWASVADAAWALAQSDEVVAHLLNLQGGPDSLLVAEPVPVSAGTGNEKPKRSKASLDELFGQLSPPLQTLYNRLDQTSGIIVRTEGAWLLIELDFDGAAGAKVATHNKKKQSSLKVLSIEPGSPPDKDGKIRMNGLEGMRELDMPDVADWYGKQAIERGIVPALRGMHPVGASKLDEIAPLLVELRSKVEDALTS